jgi:type IX secretion system PorP/SprF family membrane protein
MKANNFSIYSILNKQFIYIFLLFFLLFSQQVSAQDPQFTQFFNTPVYINPALTGTTEQWRANLLHRSQWLAIDAQHLSTTLSGELHVPIIRSGFGVLFTHDLAGTDRSLNTSFGASYSYYLPFKKWTGRLGIQASAVYQSRDFSNLMFVSQVLPNQVPISESALATSRFYADFSAGALAYSRVLWGGFAVHHLGSPTIADLATGYASLPWRLSAHGGLNITFRSGSGKTYLKPAALLKFQGAAKQFDINTRMSFENFPLILGVYYRDLVFQNGYRDALAFSAGWKIKDFVFTYSYDVTISGLTMASGGTHEISLVFEMATLAHKQFWGVNCPIFSNK